VVCGQFRFVPERSLPTQHRRWWYSNNTNRDVSTGALAASSFLQNDVKQWAVAHHEDFEDVVSGWSTEVTSSCDGENNHFAGHCNEVGGEVRRKYYLVKSFIDLFRSAKNILVCQTMITFDSSKLSLFGFICLPKLTISGWYFPFERC
jgi:hypothetical protein